VSEKLEFTGERFTPECEREIWYEHMHRYAFAAQWCAGARVLDAACGEGYGAALLARMAGDVTGVDISAPAVEHARKRYADLNGLHFEVADCTQLPFEPDSFDVVVSFETLEHLAGQAALLAEFRRVLRPQGFLVLSSPDKTEYSERHGFNNEFHVRELYLEELEQLISREFPACRLLGQKLMFHSAIWELGEITTAGLQTSSEEGEILAGRIPHPPMYFIAVCAASPEYLPAMPGSLSLFDDSDETVYRHYQHEIRKNMAAGGILAERDAEIQQLKEQLAGQGKSWWRRLLRKG
jgi:SAM-dependent methyltransferase